MRKINKRGQFFLFAAVIVSSIVLSFGAIANTVSLNQEPENLKDLSSQMKRELGYVKDYDLLHPTEGRFENFIANSSNQIRKEDPAVNFVFIYGDDSKIKIKYYGSKLVQTCMNNPSLCDGVGPTPIIQGYATIGGSPPDVITWDGDTPTGLWTEEFSGPGIESITLTVNEKDFSFKVGKIKRSIFLIQKEANNEVFIEAR